MDSSISNFQRDKFDVACSAQFAVTTWSAITQIDGHDKLRWHHLVTWSWWKCPTPVRLMDWTHLKSRPYLIVPAGSLEDFLFHFTSDMDTDMSWSQIRFLQYQCSVCKFQTVRIFLLCGKKGKNQNCFCQSSCSEACLVMCQDASKSFSCSIGFLASSRLYDSVSVHWLTQQCWFQYYDRFPKRCSVRVAARLPERGFPLSNIFFSFSSSSCRSYLAVSSNSKSMRNVTKACLSHHWCYTTRSSP